MRWLSGTMVVVEVALTLVLLVGAGLMVRSFLNRYRMDVGMRMEGLQQGDETATLLMTNDRAGRPPGRPRQRLHVWE